MEIRLYEVPPTRSARVRWILQELDLDFESVDGRPLFGTPELLEVHPLGKIPALVVDGRPLFESVAMVNYLADAHPEAGLIPASGTWERALHDQWSLFSVAELEAWLWIAAKHTFVYPEEERIPAVIEPSFEEARKALAVLEDALASQPYILGEDFSAADVNLGYPVNWARRVQLLDDYPTVASYLARLRERPTCGLPAD